MKDSSHLESKENTLTDGDIETYRKDFNQSASFRQADVMFFSFSEVIACLLSSLFWTCTSKLCFVHLTVSLEEHQETIRLSPL